MFLGGMLIFQDMTMWFVCGLLVILVYKISEIDYFGIAGIIYLI